MLEAWCEELQRGFFAYEAFRDEHMREYSWWCCPEKHAPVVPYRRHLREGYWVCSHFKLKPETNCPTGEGEVHLKKKILLANLLEEGKIIITDGLGLIVDLNEIDFTDTPRMEFRWASPSRRTDVCLPFKVFHPYFGQGIAFEIQLSGKEDSERTNDWLTAGYSVAWLTPDDFGEDTQDNNAHYGLQIPILVEYPYIFVLKNLSSQLGKIMRQVAQLELWQKNKTQSW